MPADGKRRRGPFRDQVRMANVKPWDTWVGVSRKRIRMETGFQECCWPTREQKAQNAATDRSTAGMRAAPVAISPAPFWSDPASFFACGPARTRESTNGIAEHAFTMGRPEIPPCGRAAECQGRLRCWRPPPAKFRGDGVACPNNDALRRLASRLRYVAVTTYLFLR